MQDSSARHRADAGRRWSGVRKREQGEEGARKRKARATYCGHSPPHRHAGGAQVRAVGHRSRIGGGALPASRERGHQRHACGPRRGWHWTRDRGTKGLGVVGREGSGPPASRGNAIAWQPARPGAERRRHKRLRRPRVRGCVRARHRRGYAAELSLARASRTFRRRRHFTCL